MATSNSNYYEAAAPQRRPYGSASDQQQQQQRQQQQQQQRQQNYSRQDQYAAQDYGNFNPYAQDAGNPYTNDTYENVNGQGYSQVEYRPHGGSGQTTHQARSQSSAANNNYSHASQERQYQQQQRPQKVNPSPNYGQEQQIYQAPQQASYRQEQQSRGQDQRGGYSQERRDGHGQGQAAYRDQQDSYGRDQAKYQQQQQQNGYYAQPSQQQSSSYQQGQSSGYDGRGGQHIAYDQSRSAQNSHVRPSPSRQDNRGNASYGADSYQQNSGAAYYGQQDYTQSTQYDARSNSYVQSGKQEQGNSNRDPSQRPRYDANGSGYHQSNGYHQDTLPMKPEQGRSQDAERRYDPRYQQRRDPASSQQQQYQAVGMDPRAAQRSTQSSQSSVQSGPKKLSMEEWKAQEKARMHNDAKKPETIAQDNAFPTFPTKKAESARGQSAMSMRSEDRPSTATSLRPPDTRPGLVRSHSSEQDLTGSARPSMDSQPRIGSPLQRSHTPPGARSSLRKASYSSASPTRTQGYPSTADEQRALSSADARSDSPGHTRPTTSDSRYASRKQSEQPMSPLGKFAQSAQDDATRPQNFHAQNTQSSGHDNPYDSCDHKSRRPAVTSREEEIEAEAAMFDAAPPSQSELKKRRQTIEQHLGPSHSNNNHQTPAGAPPMPNFDFGFVQQNPYSQGLDRPVQPYANETQGRRSMDNVRQPMTSNGRPVQPFADETQGRHSIDNVRPSALVNGRPAPQRFYGGASRPDYDRQTTAVSDPGVRRVGSAPPTNNPDALPAHPTPVRPGLSMNGNGTAIAEDRPAPVRTYGIAAGNVASNQAPARAASADVSSQEAVPITTSELSRLRAQVEANPQALGASLEYAKKLVEASKTLASDGGRADPKTAAKNRERYLMEAYKRVKKLASGGYPPAQFYLADCYGQGMLGLEVDPREAFKLYQAAAKAGHATAAYRTAVCCEIGAEDGGGTSKDLPRAVQWYRRAAALGETGAMFKVGMIALKGLLGQPRNLGEATIWLKRAAERADRENPHALHELAQLYETANSTPELRQKIIPDDAYSLSMYKQAADLGSKYAQFRLGQCYEYGQLGLPIDHRSSIAWYSKAAAQGEHQAELALSGWYLTGAPGILQQSDVEAYLWARKAAQAEPVLAKALFAMAYFLETGIGCPVNLDEAKRWYSRAASYKHPRALERLEAIKRGAKGGYKAMPVNARSKLNRKDQKQDEQECVVM